MLRLTALVARTSAALLGAMCHNDKRLAWFGHVMHMADDRLSNCLLTSHSHVKVYCSHLPDKGRPCLAAILMFITKAGVESVEEHNRTHLLLYGSNIAGKPLLVTVVPKCGDHQQSHAVRLFSCTTMCTGVIMLYSILFRVGTCRVRLRYV